MTTLYHLFSLLSGYSISGLFEHDVGVRPSCVSVRTFTRFERHTNCLYNVFPMYKIAPGMETNYTGNLYFSFKSGKGTETSQA